MKSASKKTSKHSATKVLSGAKIARRPVEPPQVDQDAGAKPLRAIKTGRIKRVTVVPLDDRRSVFAVVLRLKTGKHVAVRLVPPVIESQFIFQQGNTVSLPVEKIDGRWRLRLDRKALGIMKQANVYDPAKPPSAFLMNRTSKRVVKRSLATPSKKRSPTGHK